MLVGTSNFKTINAEIYLTKWWVDLSSNSRVTFNFFFFKIRKSQLSSSSWNISQLSQTIFFRRNLSSLFCLLCFFMLYKKLSIFKFFLKMVTFFPKKPKFEQLTCLDSFIFRSPKDFIFLSKKKAIFIGLWN